MSKKKPTPLRFTIPRSDLLKQIEAILPALGRNVNLPILGHIAIEAQRGRLVLSATDLSLQLTASRKLEAEYAGSTTVSGKKLHEIVKSLPASAEVTFEADEGIARVMGGRSRFKLATLPMSDYPNVEELEELSAEVSTTQGALHDMLACVAHAMAKQDVRYYLNGTAIHIFRDELRAVATDGHRLAFARADIDTSDTDRVAILDTKASNALRGLLNEPARPLTLQLSPRHIQVELPLGEGSLTFTSKLIDGKFPDYERVIPREHPCSVTVGRELLLAAVRRVSLGASSYGGITLNFNAGLLQLSGTNQQEEAVDEIDTDPTDVVAEIGVAAPLLADALATIKGNTVRIQFRDGESSLLISDSEDASRLYVVMPMRL